jgi:CRP/FNR family transcriptional regulator, cyclic AMP receptor protein
VVAVGIRILECDPELGLRIPANEIARARAALVAPVLTFDRGMWEPPRDRGAGHLGYLMLEGVLAKDVILAGTTCTELLGPGDLLHPDATLGDDALVRYRVLWHVLEPARFAVLDESVARSLGAWPQVMRSLLERALKRTLRVSLHAALLELSPVETRLLVLFWLLAERWGRVTPAGVALRLRLSHKVLGQLVGCQRASVTTALHHIEESGLIARRADRTWLLRGSPPDELAQMHWQARTA